MALSQLFPQIGTGRIVCNHFFHHRHLTTMGQLGLAESIWGLRQQARQLTVGHCQVPIISALAGHVGYQFLESVSGPAEKRLGLLIVRVGDQGDAATLAA